MKSIITSLEEVGEPFRAEYEQKDGRYILKVEGDHPNFSPASKSVELNNRVAEFRDHNIKLLKEAAELAGVEKATDLAPIRAKLEEFKDYLSPADHKVLKDKIEELEKGKQDPNDLALQFRKQLDDTVNPLKESLDKERQLRLDAQKRADDALFHNAISDKFVKAGGKANALGYIVNEAKTHFEVVENEIKSKEGVFSKKDVMTPLSIDEWMDMTTKEHDFAFADSSGGGADPKLGGPGKPGIKAGVVVLKNPSAQELGKNADAIRKGEVQVVND